LLLWLIGWPAGMVWSPLVNCLADWLVLLQLVGCRLFGWLGSLPTLPLEFVNVVHVNQCKYEYLLLACLDKVSQPD